MDRVTRHDGNFICSSWRRQATLCRYARFRHVQASFKDILPARSWMRATRAGTADRSVRLGVSEPVSMLCMIRWQSDNPRTLTISKSTPASPPKRSKLPADMSSCALARPHFMANLFDSSGQTTVETRLWSGVSATSPFALRRRLKFLACASALPMTRMRARHRSA